MKILKPLEVSGALSGAYEMKEILLLLLMMVIGVGMTDHSKLSKEQIEIINTYCHAMPECKKELEK